MPVWIDGGPRRRRGRRTVALAMLPALAVGGAAALLSTTNIVGDPELAADAVQDGFISAFRRADSFRGDAQFSTWLHRIIVNDYVNSALTAGFLFVVLTVMVYGVGACLKALKSDQPTVVETPAEHELTLSDEAMDIARA